MRERGWGGRLVMALLSHGHGGRVSFPVTIAAAYYSFTIYTYFRNINKFSRHTTAVCTDIICLYDK